MVALGTGFAALALFRAGELLEFAVKRKRQKSDHKSIERDERGMLEAKTKG